MKCHLNGETVGFLLFQQIHNQIMKQVDGDYCAKCKIKVGGKESEKIFTVKIVNGDMDFSECLAIKGLERAEVVEVKKI